MTSALAGIARPKPAALSISPSEGSDQCSQSLTSPNMRDWSSGFGGLEKKDASAETAYGSPSPLSATSSTRRRSFRARFNSIDTRLEEDATRQIQCFSPGLMGGACSRSQSGSPIFGDLDRSRRSSLKRSSVSSSQEPDSPMPLNPAMDGTESSVRSWEPYFKGKIAHLQAELDSKEVQLLDLKLVVEKQACEAKSRMASLDDVLGKEKCFRNEQVSALTERVDQLEKHRNTYCEMQAGHAADIKNLASLLGQVYKTIGTHGGDVLVGHIHAMENAVGDAFDAHSVEIARVHGRVDTLVDKVSDGFKAQKLTTDVVETNDSAEVPTNATVFETQSGQAVVAERVVFFDSSLASVQQEVQQLELLIKEHVKAVNPVRALKTWQEDLQCQFERQRSANSGISTEVQALEGRTDSLEIWRREAKPLLAQQCVCTTSIDGELASLRGRLDVVEDGVSEANRKFEDGLARQFERMVSLSQKDCEARTSFRDGFTQVSAKLDKMGRLLKEERGAREALSANLQNQVAEVTSIPLVRKDELNVVAKAMHQRLETLGTEVQSTARLLTDGTSRLSEETLQSCMAKLEPYVNQQLANLKVELKGMKQLLSVSLKDIDSLLMSRIAAAKSSLGDEIADLRNASSMADQTQSVIEQIIRDQSTLENRIEEVADVRGTVGGYDGGFQGAAIVNGRLGLERGEAHAQAVSALEEVIKVEFAREHAECQQIRKAMEEQWTWLVQKLGPEASSDTDPDPITARTRTQFKAEAPNFDTISNRRRSLFKGRALTAFLANTGYEVDPEILGKSYKRALRNLGKLDAQRGKESDSN